MFLATRGHRMRTCGAVLVVSAVLASCGGGGGGGTGPVASAGPAVQMWVTTADQSRLLARDTDQAFGATAIDASNIDVDATTRYQTMVGFGAAITDSSAWVMQHDMSSAQRDALLADLFGVSPGIGLSFTRLTIGASDFSLGQYTLDDVSAGQTDDSLAHFSIAPMRANVLPVVKSALSLNPRLQVMATPWSAPAWMKNNGSLVKSADPTIQGSLLPSAYSAFAQYLGKFADAMQAEGVPLYALTPQNEPNYEPADYPGMLLSPAARVALIGKYLGPLLAQRATPLKLLDWDHNWDDPAAAMASLNDPVAQAFVAGVAWHCYAGDVSSQTAVDNAFPATETYVTECSGGAWAPVWADNLLWSVNTLVINATRDWAKGVLLWNLALDENSGPHTGGCTNCRGVVTINSATGDVTRNVEYYALAHASRFVRPGAQRITSSTAVNGLQSVAFRNADDGSLALIVANGAGRAMSFSVRQAGQTFSYSMPAGAVATFVWTPAA